jgi:hypothetical protein
MFPTPAASHTYIYIYIYKYAYTYMHIYSCHSVSDCVTIGVNQCQHKSNAHYCNDNQYPNALTNNILLHMQRRFAHQRSSRRTCMSSCTNVRLAVYGQALPNLLQIREAGGPEAATPDKRATPRAASHKRTSSARGVMRSHHAGHRYQADVIGP